ncbi:MAG TPA: cold shock domain-containing protein [Phnomibacter sp.]|nr:cold shock domain-containing protein [Phnomibacter sp.]
MAKSQQSWGKQEREKQKQKAKQEKAERKQERKAQGAKGIDEMMAWLDEDGNIVNTPPDPNRRKEVKLEDIEIGVPKQRELDAAELIRTGVVTFFNTAKGFGFIKDAKTQESIFVHINQTQEPIAENNKVQYEVEKGPKGLNAVRVKLVK